MSRIRQSVIVLCAVFAATVTSHAQDSRQPLSVWQLADNIDLQGSALDDPDLHTMLIGNKILVASPGLHTDECGSVTVYELQSDGSIVELQMLPTFNGCDAVDGFGYSMDFTSNVLVVGAPGQISFAEGAPVNLSGGAIYIYRFDETSNRFDFDTRFLHVGQPGDQAWGTRVATDGSRILVQGNEPVVTATDQGNANPRTVTLISNTSSGWQFAQSFTDNSPDMFGQDFAIANGLLVINQHTFTGVDECAFVGESRFAAEYQTEVAVYQSPLLIGPYAVLNSIEFQNHTADQNVTARLEQVIPHSSESGALVSVYDGGLSCGSFSQGHGDVLAQLAFDESGEIVVTGRVVVKQSFNRLDPDNDLEFPNNNSVAVDNEQVLVLDFDRGALPVVENFEPVTSTVSNDINSGFANHLQRQRFTGAPDNEFIRGSTLTVNPAVDTLTLTGSTDGQNSISVHQTIPALDPAITQTWWFGPEFSGQGVTFEVISDNRLIMYWLTFDFNGNQMWLRGVGQLQDGEVEVTLIRPSGPQFDQALFDPADRVREVWGTATLQFDDCNTGTLRYNSDEFGSGELPMETFIGLDPECDTGIIRRNGEGIDFVSTNVGSFFDTSRNGEGLVLMPLPDNCRADIIDRSHACRLGYLLTYDAQGEQSWLGLGTLVDRFGEQTLAQNCFAVPSSGELLDCEFKLETPGLAGPDGPARRPMGGIFGSAFDPAQVVRMPWGDRSPTFIPEGFGSDNQRFIRFTNPDGEAILQLQQLSVPLGYLPLTDRSD